MHTFPTVTMCVAYEEPDAVKILGAADAGDGVESWPRTTFARATRHKGSTTEAILFYTAPTNAGKMCNEIQVRAEGKLKMYDRSHKFPGNENERLEAFSLLAAPFHSTSFLQLTAARLLCMHDHARCVVSWVRLC